MSYESDITDANRLVSENRSSEAIPLYEKWAEQSSGGCNRYLGWLYLEGVGCSKNIDKAENYFAVAAELDNDQEARFGIAKCHIARKSYDAACQVLCKLAEAGYAPSQYWLGWFYENGISVGKDINKSMYFYGKAASAGHIYASQRECYLLLRGAKGFVFRFYALARRVRLLFVASSVASGDRRTDARLLK